MAKQTGLGAAFWLDGVDLSGDVGSLGRINGGNTPIEVTGIDKSAYERLGGPRDGGVEFMAYMNPSAGAAHPTLAPLTTADRIATYCHRTTLGAPAACLVAKQVNYDANRAEDGSLTWSVTAESNQYGLEWGQLLTAGKRVDTGAANGTGVDFEAGASFGLQAWLHVFAFTGTDVTIKLQESSDNAGDAYADVTGGAFTAVTAGPTKQRIQTARDQAVERYLRVVTTTSGGFTSVTFGVVATLNPVSVVF